jgi:hypothetical protein
MTHAINICPGIDLFDVGPLETGIGRPSLLPAPPATTTRPATCRAT